MLDLSKYDGSAGFLVDTSIWIDCMDADSPWHEWAVDQLQNCSEQAPLHINLMIYTELLIPGPDVEALNAMLDVYDTLRSPLPWACAALAAQAYLGYRRGGGTRLVPLPDFYIGAHAAVSNLCVLSRDVKPYRNYFPRLLCIGFDEKI
ncbi:PIN domain-containing protein OS=Eoetvoesiella caeni OX=645616 GN=DFR37_102588 PE=3 SV=1 [Eoetvoesiella caeni]